MSGECLSYRYRRFIGFNSDRVCCAVIILTLYREWYDTTRVVDKAEICFLLMFLLGEEEVFFMGIDITTMQQQASSQSHPTG